jgi:anaerobic magnesium-protoporphyrin IX monomethyl ester cyclase
MRVLLADLKGEGGFVSKDTVAGGYGSRLRPFSRVTSVISALKQRFHDLPSLQMGYAAALAAAAGHEVSASSGEFGEADVALVLSSLVDFRRETAWAQAMRARGVRVGFLGLAASKLPQLFDASADFVILGEPESALERLFGGEQLTGRVDSPPPADLDALPHPRWDLITGTRRQFRVPFAGRPAGGALPVLASRSCPEFCTYCPHRILATYRARSTASILDEVIELAAARPGIHIVFRDPLFTESRDRVMALVDGIRTRGLNCTFECETRLDRLDRELLTAMRGAGLRAMSFGVEAVSGPMLRKVGRRPIPESHQREVVAHCRSLGIVTAAFYVFGFPEDDWQSVSATIEYAIELGSTVAQFKILTPYPGTPLFKRLEPHITEADWEQFDGFTPTFTHATLTQSELKYLLGAAYTRFYMRPSYLANYLRLSTPGVQRFVTRLDARVERLHARREESAMARAVSC